MNDDIPLPRAKLWATTMHGHGADVITAHESSTARVAPRDPRPPLDGRAISHRVGGRQHAGPQARCDPGRVIRGAIVDHDDLGIRIGGAQRRQRALQALRLVLCRQHDSYGHGISLGNRSLNPVRGEAREASAVRQAPVPRARPRHRASAWNLRYRRGLTSIPRDAALRAAGSRLRVCGKVGQSPGESAYR